MVLSLEAGAEETVLIRRKGLRLRRRDEQRVERPLRSAHARLQDSGWRGRRLGLHGSVGWSRLDGSHRIALRIIAMRPRQQSLALRPFHGTMNAAHVSGALSRFTRSAQCPAVTA